MKLSAEISMYPFNEDYLSPIRAYIEKLNEYHGLSIATFPMSTVISGEYDTVMAAITDSIRWSHKKFAKAVFVAKLIPGHE